MVGTQEPLNLSYSASSSSYTEVRPLSVFNLQANRQLVFDLISVHLIRHVDGNTIISFHPADHASETDRTTTSAKYLHERIRFAGKYTIHPVFIN
jgi:hypothetical protein